MKLLLIQNAGAIAPADTPDPPADPTLVASAVLGGFNHLGAGIGLTVASPARFMLVQGAAQPRLTALLEKANITNVTKTAHAAKVHQITTLSSFTSIPAGDPVDCTITLTDVTDGFEQFPRLSYTVSLAGGTANNAIVTAFVAAINANPMSFVVASGSTTLILTAKAANPKRSSKIMDGIRALSFRTGLTNLIATITPTAAPIPGSGTPEQVAYFEQESWGNLAFYQRLQLPQTPVSFVLSNGEYLLYTISYKTNAERSINKSFMNNEIVLAVNAGVTGSLDTFLGV